MKEILVNVDETNNKTIVLLENGIVVEKYYENEQDTRVEGNIYLGKVQNVIPGLQAAFVDIGKDKNTFIHLKDILPKIDEKQEDISNILNQDIRKIVKQGDTLLVQVKRDSANKKGARVSTHINLPGCYCVLLPNTPFVTVSQKIEDENEIQRLKSIFESVLPQNYGAIVRTSAIGKDKENLEQDINQLIKVWEKIKEKETETEAKKVPILIHKNYSVVEKILLDLSEQGLEKIIVNNKQTYKEISEIIANNTNNANNTKNVKNINNTKITLELKEENLIEIYDIKKQLTKLENRKIWLKCGGFITIDKTEALTAIDVNTGKYTGSKKLEDTVFEVNRQASIEIAKQLRLRDIGGIIIIDYIDMQSEEHKQKIIQTLKDSLKKDRSKTQIVGFSKLNLLEMTRKHIYSKEE